MCVCVCVFSGERYEHAEEGSDGGVVNMHPHLPLCAVFLWTCRKLRVSSFSPVLQVMGGSSSSAKMKLRWTVESGQKVECVAFN